MHSVDKANVLESSRLWREVVHRLHQAEFADVELVDQLVDNTAMQLIREPAQFDVVVTENMFGDILSDQAAGLVGGLGFAPGVNIGKDVAMFEAVHGSAPDIAGRDIANPTALLLAGVLMLEHLGLRETAERIRKAIKSVISEKRTVTRDLGGTATTTEYADAVIERIEAGVETV